MSGVLGASRHLGEAFLSQLNRSPDACVLVGTLGLLLIALEFNRPGLIVAAATGLSLFLLSTASLLRQPLRGSALVLLVASTGVLLMSVWRIVPVVWLVTASCGLAASLFWLMQPGSAKRVHLPVAIGCGLVLGGLGSTLSRVALRARRAKQVH